VREYEAMIILQPELIGDALTLAFGEVTDILKKHQCDVENIDDWGKKPLAYEISKKKEGFYYVLKIKAEPTNISKINMNFTLNENILRVLVSARPKEKKVV